MRSDWYLRIYWYLLEFPLRADSNERTKGNMLLLQIIIKHSYGPSAPSFVKSLTGSLSFTSRPGQTCTFTCTCSFLEFTSDLTIYKSSDRVARASMDSKFQTVIQSNLFIKLNTLKKSDFAFLRNFSTLSLICAHFRLNMEKKKKIDTYQSFKLRFSSFSVYNWTSYRHPTILLAWSQAYFQPFGCFCISGCPSLLGRWIKICLTLGYWYSWKHEKRDYHECANSRIS